MVLSRLILGRFTAFRHLDLALTSGINAIVGPNGIGKTHILKALYSACLAAGRDERIDTILVDVFLPLGGRAEGNIGRLVRLGEASGFVEVMRKDGAKIRCTFDKRARVGDSSVGKAIVRPYRKWASHRMECAYIPARDVLANAPGFLSAYMLRDIACERTYADALLMAFRPELRGGPRGYTGPVLDRLKGPDGLDGTVIMLGEQFFLQRGEDRLEFSLLSEGSKKLALLYLLVSNGTVAPGSILFWDDVDTGLDPSSLGLVISVLLNLQREGVQVFLSTRNPETVGALYSLVTAKDSLSLHSLYRDKHGVLQYKRKEVLGEV